MARTQTLVWAGGMCTAYTLENDPQSSARWLAQHCTTHDGPDTADHMPPEWEEFQPTGKHTRLVRPLPDEPTPVAW